MEVWTTKPGIQLYTANFLDPGTPGKGGVPFGPRQGVCLETQFFPDSPNHPSGATSSSAPADGTTTPPNTGSGRIDKNSPGWKHFPARLRL